MCRSGPGRPDGAVSRLCPTPRRGGASRTRKPRATAVGLGWPAEAKGEPRSSRPRPSAPQTARHSTQHCRAASPMGVRCFLPPSSAVYYFTRNPKGTLSKRRRGSAEGEKIWESGDEEREGGRGDICGMRVGVHAPPHMAHPAASPSPPPLTALESHWNHTLDRASPLAPSLAVRGGNRRLGASTRGRRLRPL